MNLNGQLMTFAVTLDPSPQSVAIARHTLDEWAHEVGALGVIETAVLLVSEIATTVVQHAATTFAVTTFTMSGYWLPPILRVEVTDSAAVPTRVERETEQDGGRRFMLLDELSRRWGIEERRGGTKAVWFEVEQFLPPTYRT